MPALLVLLLALLLAGCAAAPVTMPDHLQSRSSQSDSAEAGLESQERQSRSVPRITLPALNVSEWPDADESKWAGLGLSDKETNLNVDAMPLNRFLQVALGDVLELSFIVDPEVQARTEPVTLRVSKPMPARHLLDTIEQLLAGFSVGLTYENETLRVLPASKLMEIPPTFVNSRSKLAMQQGKIMTIVPLRYVSYADIMRFARHFIQLGSSASVEYMARINSVVIVGDAAKVARFNSVIELLDQPSMTGRKMEIFRPIYWQAEDIIQLLRDTLKAQGVILAATPENPGLYISHIKQLNGLIVAAHDVKLLKWVDDWISAFDTPEVAGDSLKTFVYPVKHSPAEDLGGLVRQVLSSAGAKGTGNELTMVVDETRNFLIFVGRAQAYEAVYRLMERVDVPAKQVLLEVTVADLTIDNNSQLGVEWQWQDNGSDGVVDGIGNTIGGLGVGTAGFTYSALDSDGSLRARLNALATKGDAKILSSPKLLAVDNEEARINVGTQIAVITSENTSDSVDGIIRSFQYIDTGVILSFTPTVMAGEQVRLQVSQTVSQPGVSIGNTPPISTRSVETTLIAKSGITIMIGGLISTADTDSNEQVPLFGEIPVLGALFKSRRVTSSSTEMIVLITPHIIESSAQIEALTEDFQSKIDWSE